MPNLQRVKALINGEVRYIRVSANALKKGLVTKAPKRRWTKEAAAEKKA
jgi:ribosomal protein L28